MRKIVTLLLVLSLLCALPVSAENGQVIYSGDAGDFIFAPGSEESLTDLFPNFKNVMPGDSLTQTITVRNDASKKVKVKIYVRSLGAAPDSEEFLSQLHMKVAHAPENEMAYMFDAAANEMGGMEEWQLLGTLYSGGEVNLNVILEVPVTLDNKFQQQIGFLDWEFRIGEYPIEPTDPQPPTGDDTPLWLWGGLMATSLLLLLFAAKRKPAQ
jgi:hypothetical protein